MQSVNGTDKRFGENESTGKNYKKRSIISLQNRERFALNEKNLFVA